MLICVAVIAFLPQQAKNCTQFHASNYRVTKMRLLRGLHNIKAYIVHISLTAASRPEAYQALPSSLCTSVFYLPPLLLIPPSFPISPPLPYPLPSSSFLSFPSLSPLYPSFSSPHQRCSSGTQRMCASGLRSWGWKSITRASTPMRSLARSCWTFTGPT